MIVYEPALKDESFYNSKVVRDLAEFKRLASVIVANRVTDEIAGEVRKVYTRDLFRKD